MVKMDQKRRFYVVVPEEGTLEVKDHYFLPH